MSSSQPRSVKIPENERGGWSSERPRRAGEPERPERPVDVSTRCRVLSPTDRMRYSPGSLVVVVAGEPGAAEAFAARAVEDRGAVLSMPKVRAMLEGRVAGEEVEDKARALLDAAVAKRLEHGQSVVVPLEDLATESRAGYVRTAVRHRRPRHLVLVETGKERVPEEDQAALNDLRRTLDAGGLGAEGFSTALRLGGRAVGELKRIVFAPPPSDD